MASQAFWLAGFRALAGEGRELTSWQSVDVQDIIALLEHEMTNESGADEARTPGYNYSHR